MPNVIQIDSAVAALRIHEKTPFRVGFFVNISIDVPIRSSPRLQSHF